jgi:uncharacterized membrane protein YesL
MSKLFDLDSKFMQKATKFGDLVFLNILTVICCIPVITIGPAFTAMHYTLLKLYRDEEGGLFKTYFHSFFGNLRQGILLTLVYLVYFGILVLNYQLGRRTENVMRIVLYVLPFFALVGGMSLCWLFPMLSRYSNTIIGTIKTTLAATLAHPFKSLMMTALMIAPFLILLLTNWGVPILMTIGLSLCGYLRVMLYDPTFKMLERVRDPEEDEEDAGEDAEEDFEEE